MTQAVGIAALGTAIPAISLRLDELATLRGANPDKYRLGLGCDSMSLADPGTTAVDLATKAARRAIHHWGGDVDQIGLIAVGTESALDMSRPLSAWVADRLELQGRVRSYEVKHACYGGTLALRQAVEWIASGAARGKVALVIAADIALYAPEHPGEPTQGAGAVAMIVGEPRVARVIPVSYPYSEPAFDFWRPTGEAFPRVAGKLSLDCYKRAAESCFRAWAEDEAAPFDLDSTTSLCFHVPFPKMVKKAFLHVGEQLGWPEELATHVFHQKVAPTMTWNREIGNSYTASLWVSVASALRGTEVGTRLAAFSYGSGCGAELLLLEAGPEAKAAVWATDMEADLAGRSFLDIPAYEAFRAQV
jgi:hydroxymethylglutaryl-CoA synthase